MPDDSERLRRARERMGMTQRQWLERKYSRPFPTPDMRARLADRASRMNGGAGPGLMTREGLPIPENALALGKPDVIEGGERKPGPYRAASRAEVDMLASMLADERVSDPALSGRGQMSVVPDGKDFKTQLILRGDLSPQQRYRIGAHESGHIVALMAGLEEAFAGLPDDMQEAVINQTAAALGEMSPPGTFDDSNGWSKRFSERFAELFWLYLKDPKRAEEIAPDASRLLRRIINTNPETRDRFILGQKDTPWATKTS